jgi:hypothetical protein
MVKFQTSFKPADLEKKGTQKRDETMRAVSGTLLWNLWNVLTVLTRRHIFKCWQEMDGILTVSSR